MIVTVESSGEAVPSSSRVVAPEMGGLRLDVVATLLFPDFSRTQIHALLDEECLLYDGCAAKKRMAVTAGGVLTLFLRRQKTSTIQKSAPTNFAILYEDDDLFVIDKPSGLVVHPGAGNHEVTFSSTFLQLYPEIEKEGFDPNRPGIVHRLDKDTSGVLIATKNKRALFRISEQFQERTVSKEYLALVWGLFPHTTTTLTTHIARCQRDRKRMTIVTGAGRYAESHFERVQLFSQASCLKIQPKTGRTHQIRLHLEHLGFPIIGDKVYSTQKLIHRSIPYAQRQMLHCHQMSFLHPTTGTLCTFSAPMPDDMRACLQQLEHRA